MAEEKMNAKPAVTTQHTQSGPGFVMNYNLLALWRWHA